MVIGVAGVAGAGKDLFCDTLKSELESHGKRVLNIALAKALKEEVKDWCVAHYNINPLSCTREEKAKIRDFLVFHGTQKRHQSEGKHWITLAHKTIQNLKNEYDYFIISDIRYHDYTSDEVSWLKEELSGPLVHISQYEVKEVPDRKNWPKTKMGRVFLEPANEEEKRNDPKLQRSADFPISWEKVDIINKDKYVKEHVVKFTEWLNTR